MINHAPNIRVTVWLDKDRVDELDNKNICKVYNNIY